MCDFSGRLVAWMDGELAENEAAEIDRHVGVCEECRAQLSAYDEVSRGFAAYYDAATRTATAAEAHRKLPRWVPIAAATAVAAVLLLALLPRPTKPVPAVPQAALAPAPAVHETKTKPNPAAKRHVAARRKTSVANWAMAEPAIQIAIPADAMFPPGAVPEGVTYIANLSFAADGSVQGFRLQP